MQPQYREARKLKKIKLTDAAKMLGVSQPTLSGWEGGRMSPNPEKLMRMADLYGVSVDFLLGRSPVKLNTANSPIPLDALPAFHARPVWSEQHGWMIVDAVEHKLMVNSGLSLEFEAAGPVFAYAPRFAESDAPQGKPIFHTDIDLYEKIWVEPISGDAKLREELRGWYKVKDRYVENEYGNRFYFDTYNAKWLAFKDI